MLIIKHGLTALFLYRWADSSMSQYNRQQRMARSMTKGPDTPCRYQFTDIPNRQNITMITSEELKDLNSFQIAALLEHAAAMGAMMALIRTGRLRPYLNKSQAFSSYGRSRVEKWIEAGLVTRRKDGDHTALWRLDRLELESLSRTEEFHAMIYRKM